jgi:RNA polymerase sigma-70 factor (ECF subfamily)
VHTDSRSSGAPNFYHVRPCFADFALAAAPRVTTATRHPFEQRSARLWGRVAYPAAFPIKGELSLRTGTSVRLRTCLTEADDEFARLADPYRNELLALCYRMLGSVHEAEDAVQESFLRAWRSYGQFAGRSSLKTWLYRITTHVCLRSLERASRRPLPSGLGGPCSDPEGSAGPSLPEVPWLQPFPTSLDSCDPASVVERRSSTRLALVAALQFLPPRQRVVLILRDVLDWPAAEVAAVLEISTTAVNSLLRRARAQFTEDSPVETAIPESLDARQRALLERYAAAFETANISELVQVLREDAVWEMPPFPTWFVGRESIGRFLAKRLPPAGRGVMVQIEANGQPAFALYVSDHDSDLYHAHALQVLTLTDSGITRIVAFLDPNIFPIFGLSLSRRA